MINFYRPRILHYPVLALAGLAATAAGTGMQIAANRATSRAMTNAQSAERVRQEGYRKNSQAIVDQSIARSGADTAEKEMGDAAKKRVTSYEGAQVGSIGLGAPVTPQGSSAVQADADDAKQEANAWTKLGNVSQANLSSTSDWLQNQAIANSRANQALGVESNLARGSASILPIEMQGAQNKYDSLRGWGQGVSALGSVAGMAGSMGYGPMIGATSAAPAGTFTTPTASYAPWTNQAIWATFRR